MKKLFLIIATALTVVSCHTGKQAGKPMPGADRDRHGCIASAGYTWSKVRKDCVRTFEEGIHGWILKTGGTDVYVSPQK